MPVYAFEGRTPNIAAAAFVSETAIVIGDVRIADRVYVGHGAICGQTTDPSASRRSRRSRKGRSSTSTLRALATWDGGSPSGTGPRSTAPRSVPRQSSASGRSSLSECA